MDNQKSEKVQPSRASVLALAYLVAAGVGYLAGTHGVFGRPVANPATQAPLARVGFALSQDNLVASPAGWAMLKNDTEVVRRGWKPEDRNVFDLLVALRALESAGETDFARAEALCHSLNWTRCDRAALEELKKRSRP